MHNFMVTSLLPREYFAFCSRGWSVCGKDVKYIVVSCWDVYKLTKRMRSKQVYIEVTQCKLVVAVTDCPVIPADIR